MPFKVSNAATTERYWDKGRWGVFVCLCMCVCGHTVLENDTEELAPLQQGGAISHISLIHLSVPCARNKRLWWSVTQKQLPDGPVVYTLGMLPWRPWAERAAFLFSPRCWELLGWRSPSIRQVSWGLHQHSPSLLWLLAAPAELPEGNNSVTKSPQEKRRAGLWALFFACSHMAVQVIQEWGH